MEQLGEIIKALGLDPALAGIAIVLAILLRYARGMIRQMNSELTFVTAAVFGFAGSAIDDGWLAKDCLKDTLAIMCIVLVAQKLLEKLAGTIAWLPQDNEWVRSATLPALAPVKVEPPANKEVGS